jgi:DNA recombination protein RmuC
VEIIIYLIIGVLLGLAIGVLFSRSKSAGLEAGNKMLNDSLTQVKTELDSERNKNTSLNSDLSKSRSDYSNLEEKLKDQKNEIAELQEKFTIEFENLANRILDEKSKKFTDQNKENIDTILSPLKEKITDFEKRVNDVYASETKDRAALAEQLKQLHELNKVMTDEANNLTKALKGDSKTQGNWGEFILENVLEKSGLVKGREYLIQETLRNEAGEMLRPDVIVRLPEDKSIIIDSKVSLNAYEAYSSSDNDDDTKKYLSEHVGSIRRHIKGLSPKDYQNLYGIQSLDFVLMFIPIEPAFAAAVQNDQSLFYEAFEKNIIIVSPTTLLATLRTISSIWKQEKQNKNALEIAKQGGALYDKFVAFVEDLKSIGNKIDSTKETYTEAMKKLYDGTGNLVKRAEKIRELGIKSTKTLPQQLIDRASDDNDQ